MTKRICLLAYPDMELLDLSGPQSAFHEANSLVQDSYELTVVGFNQLPITCEAGTVILPSQTIYQISQCDTLIIPGGKGSRSVLITSEEIEALEMLAMNSRRVVSICTGAFLLAQIGVPIGAKVTTHWAFLDGLKASYPHLLVEKEKLYVRDGKYWSSAGVTAGIDLALKLIELDLDIHTAQHVAKHLVVYLQRSGNQKQFSKLLDTQGPKKDKLKHLENWLKQNAEKVITVDQLAKLLCVSERQCYRFFQTNFHSTPTQFVERTKMSIASALLESTNKDLSIIASAVGYETTEGFRRAFARNYSVSPAQYRQSFTHNGGAI
jgi:transcriptional regulator GlxA family with amidase domain